MEQKIHAFALEENRERSAVERDFKQAIVEQKPYRFHVSDLVPADVYQRKLNEIKNDCNNSLLLARLNLVLFLFPHIKMRKMRSVLTTILFYTSEQFATWWLDRCIGINGMEHIEMLISGYFQIEDIKRQMGIC
ncbi:hypothetical protein EOM86_13605 [Candidatus Nomurabacteria bacterium]|nr:hypothetical protein [Candidatus Nomurabacteria bacterium]